MSEMREMLNCHSKLGLTVRFWARWFSLFSVISAIFFRDFRFFTLILYFLTELSKIVDFHSKHVLGVENEAKLGKCWIFTQNLFEMAHFEKTPILGQNLQGQFINWTWQKCRFSCKICLKGADYVFVLSVKNVKSHQIGVKTCLVHFSTVLRKKVDFQSKLVWNGLFYIRLQKTPI